MKKYLSLFIFISLAITLVSWGFKGHQTVAIIAEDHLTPKANEEIINLLGGQKISEIASWADEVRNQAAYKQTSSMHYINAPLGLNYEQFAALVKSQGDNNVYGAIMKYAALLTSTGASKDEKAEALKFVVHFVGDIHQPFHVSRAEDKGGNTIQVQFEGKDTNLHSLWDSKLIDREGLTTEQMAKLYDSANPEQIKRWQIQSPMQWAWESYQLSTQLYIAVEKNNILDDAYYQKQIPIVHQRIALAGIRLAGLLNQIFTGVNGKSPYKESYPPPVVKSGPGNIFPPVQLNEVSKHIGAGKCQRSCCRLQRV
ncbi:S1/P1 nuclease [Mucilaginibacter sp.]|uniref:S1/P1 nuclease n=1 Tax=Mucilaginibacter sp. TaxID=1882438 RepID=UPI003D0ADDF9